MATSSIPWFDDSPGAYLGPGSASIPGKIGQWGQVTFTVGKPQDSLTFVGELTGRHGTKIDWKPRMAKAGSTPTNLQRRQTEVDAHLKILTPGDLDSYVVLLQSLRRFSNAGLAVGVVHPGLKILGVSHLYYTEGDIPRAPSPGKPAVFVLRFREWIQSPSDGTPAVATTPDVGIQGGPGVGPFAGVHNGFFPPLPSNTSITAAAPPADNVTLAYDIQLNNR